MTKFLYVFLFTFFLGEPGVFLVSFGSAQGFVNYFIVITACYASALLGESLWFLLAKKIVPGDVNIFIDHKLKNEKLKKYLAKMSAGKIFRILLFSRLVSGFSVIVLLYLGKKREYYALTYRKFLSIVCLVDLIWTAVVFTLGFLTGKGFGLIRVVFEDVRIVTTSFAIIFLLFFLLKKYASKYFLRKI